MGSQFLNQCRPSALAAWNLNHWTSRGVPCCTLLPPPHLIPPLPWSGECNLYTAISCHVSSHSSMFSVIIIRNHETFAIAWPKVGSYYRHLMFLAFLNTSQTSLQVSWHSSLIHSLWWIIFYGVICHHVFNSSLACKSHPVQWLSGL